MKKASISLVLALLFTGCDMSNVQVQEILRAPVTLDTLTVTAEDGNDYELEALGERSYTVRVPDDTTFFTINVSGHKGAAVDFVLQSNENGEEFISMGEERYVEFLPDVFKESRVFKVTASKQYMETAVYTITVVRGGDSLIWDAKIRTTYEVYKKAISWDNAVSSRLLWKDSNGEEKSLFDESSSDYYATVDPNTTEETLLVYLRANTVLQFAVSHGGYAADWGKVVVPEEVDEKHNWKAWYSACLTTGPSLSSPVDWETGVAIKARVWFRYERDEAGNVLWDKEYTAPGTIVNPTHEYTEYTFTLRRYPKIEAYLYVAGDASSAPPGTKFVLNNGYYEGDPRDTSDDDRTFGYTNTGRPVTFTITPPLGIKITEALIYKAKDFESLGAEAAPIYTHVFANGNSTTAYSMGEDDLKVSVRWDWDCPVATSGPAITGGAIEYPEGRPVRFCVPDGAPYDDNPDNVMGPAGSEDKRLFGSGTSWATATNDLQALIDNWDGTYEIWMAGGTYLPYWRWAVKGNAAYIEGLGTTDEVNNEAIASAVSAGKVTGKGSMTVTGNGNPTDPARWFFAFSQPGLSVYGGFAGTETARGYRDGAPRFPVQASCDYWYNVWYWNIPYPPGYNDDNWTSYRGYCSDRNAWAYDTWSLANADEDFWEQSDADADIMLHPTRGGKEMDSAHETVLSGDLSAYEVIQASHVALFGWTKAAAEGTSTVIEGVTMSKSRGGEANYTPWLGGIKAVISGPQDSVGVNAYRLFFNRVTISNNCAYQVTLYLEGRGPTGATSGSGGGDGFPHFYNSVIKSNSSANGRGGGVYANECPAVFINCAIVNNSAKDRGCGLDFVQGDCLKCALTLKNCVIAGNISEEGQGAGYFEGEEWSDWGGYTCLFDHVTIAGNSGPTTTCLTAGKTMIEWSNSVIWGNTPARPGLYNKVSNSYSTFTSVLAQGYGSGSTGNDGNDKTIWNKFKNGYDGTDAANDPAFSSRYAVTNPALTGTDGKLIGADVTKIPEWE